LSKINDKDILVLFGTTGSGKSTLANALISGVQNISK
jgi:putative ribosome biogenesis GTPase RsgA